MNVLLAAAGIYVVVQIAADVLYGQRWFTRGDAFEAYSTLLGHLSVLGRTAAGRLVIRNPLQGLPPYRPESPGCAAVPAARGHLLRRLDRHVDVGRPRTERAQRLRGLVGEPRQARHRRDDLRAVSPGKVACAQLVSIIGGYAVDHYFTVAAGFPLADRIVGLIITVAILPVLRTAVRDIYRRLVDTVDPPLVDEAETALLATPGVTAVRAMRMRCIGHTLHAEADLDIDGGVTVTEAHALAHQAEHRLTHAVPKLRTAAVHAYPALRSDTASTGHLSRRSRDGPRTPCRFMNRRTSMRSAQGDLHLICTSAAHRMHARVVS